MVCSYGTDKVFRFHDNKYWDYVDTYEWIADSEFHMVSCYTDLGSLPTKKTLRKMYFELEGENVNCGYLYAQTDMDKLRQIHVDGETDEPDGSKTGYSWIGYGEKEWDTDEYFDDDDGAPDPVEHKERCEVPTFEVGNRFRYAIKGGTHTSSYNGKLKIGIPTALVSAIKGKTSE